jgi:hypothetical protein
MNGMQMNMPLPANTLPMSTGAGRYGDIEMGGMFTMVKIRADVAHGDYRDPGWYQAPAGSVAYAWEGDPPPAARGEAPPTSERAPYTVRKPSGSMEH